MAPGFQPKMERTSSLQQSACTWSFSVTPEFRPLCPHAALKFLYVMGPPCLHMSHPKQHIFHPSMALETFHLACDRHPVAILLAPTLMELRQTPIFFFECLSVPNVGDHHGYFYLVGGNPEKFG
ncbi:hypothetical protein M8J77_005452 [Diaphorina citri]|nr:hypothetical protein M8J77_005452 [Diaphorina citri]